jgi:PHP family Zn ribbon phosphoesterase
MFSQLGFVPEGLPIDALEVSPRYSTEEVGQCFPYTRGYPLVSFSDAHRLEEIGKTSTTFTGSEPSVKELHKALLGKDGREVIN